MGLGGAGDTVKSGKASLKWPSLSRRPMLPNRLESNLTNVLPKSTLKRGPCEAVFGVIGGEVLQF